MKRSNLVALGVVLVLAFAAMWWGKNMSTTPASVVPAKQQTSLATGEALFKKYCLACHGAEGAGSAKGPPLIHKIYEPNHHGDQSFYNAALNGVRRHHWKFGDMPPVAGIKLSEVVEITKYIRAIQRANGIY